MKAAVRENQAENDITFSAAPLAARLYQLHHHLDVLIIRIKRRNVFKFRRQRAGRFRSFRR